MVSKSPYRSLSKRGIAFVLRCARASDIDIAPSPEPYIMRSMLSPSNDNIIYMVGPFTKKEDAEYLIKTLSDLGVENITLNTL